MTIDLLQSQLNLQQELLQERQQELSHIYHHGLDGRHDQGDHREVREIYEGLSIHEAYRARLNL
jgi:hypothetical protein